MRGASQAGMNRCSTFTNIMETHMRLATRVLFALAIAALVIVSELATAQQPSPARLFRGLEPDTALVGIAQTTALRRFSRGKLPAPEKANSGTVTVITAPVGGAFAAMGSDLVRVLDDGDNLRVLPIIGKGSVQNLVDIMVLRSVDMGFVVSDALEFVKTEYDLPDIAQRVVYIVKLFNNDLHIIARKDIRTIRDLAGKKIMSERNLGYFTVRTVFNRLNIAADIDFRTDDAGGLQKFLNGGADAWIVSAGKVAPIIRNIQNAEGKFHFVSVPYEKSLNAFYLPSVLTSGEYPNLVAPGEDVDTIASSTLLMVYNWPPGTERYNRVAKFVDALFSKIDQFRDPARHPKWRDTNLSASVAGWQRFKAAEDWLSQRRVPIDGTAQMENASTADTSLGEENALFSQFLKWQKIHGN
jgi:uncharacterized protein